MLPVNSLHPQPVRMPSKCVHITNAIMPFLNHFLLLASLDYVVSSVSNGLGLMPSCEALAYLPTVDGYDSVRFTGRVMIERHGNRRLRGWLPVFLGLRVKLEDVRSSREDRLFPVCVRTCGIRFLKEKQLRKRTPFVLLLLL